MQKKLFHKIFEKISNQLMKIMRINRPGVSLRSVNRYVSINLKNVKTKNSNVYFKFMHYEKNARKTKNFSFSKLF